MGICIYMCVSVYACVLVAQSCLTLVTLGTVAHQSPLSMKFSRQEYWSGQAFSSPGDLPNQGIKPVSLALQTNSLPSEPPGEPIYTNNTIQCSLLFQDLTGFPFVYSKHIRENHGLNICQLLNENYSPKIQGTRWGANNDFL